MNLRDEILKEHSKAQCNKIVEWVGGSKKRFNELLQLFLHDEYRVVQHAAWPVSYCVIAHPKLVDPHLTDMVANLNKPGVHDAVKRNILRFLQQIIIPEPFHGEIMDSCFRFISSPDEPAAVKAFALTVLGNLSVLYPEIRPEMALIIEERLPFETAAFKSRANKLLRTINATNKK